MFQVMSSISFGEPMEAELNAKITPVQYPNVSELESNMSFVKSLENIVNFRIQVSFNTQLPLGIRIKSDKKVMVLLEQLYRLI